jgi:hypothetical protein
MTMDIRKHPDPLSLPHDIELENVGLILLGLAMLWSARWLWTSTEHDLWTLFFVAKSVLYGIGSILMGLVEISDDFERQDKERKAELTRRRHEAMFPKGACRIRTRPKQTVPSTGPAPRAA